ncbi:MAG: enoyl-CoA hydratase/isomerase family protein [Sporichthyaceae bacterium]
MVRYEKRDAIAYVTLDRPEARNAIDLATHEALQEIFVDFRDDPDLRVAILTGTGESFCAGADLKTHVPLWTAGDGLLPRRKVADGLGGITRGLHRIYKPIVAAVNGWALAGGFELALAADIRIASERAMFGSFEVRRGFHHADGGIVRLVNICGTGLAFEMLLTGEPIDARRAERVGLVSRVVPPDHLLAVAEEVAAAILRNDRAAVESAKETIIEVVGRPLDDQLRIEAMLGYSMLANPTVPELLDRFYARTDAGRAGPHSIPSAPHPSVP